MRARTTPILGATGWCVGFVGALLSHPTTLFAQPEQPVRVAVDAPQSDCVSWSAVSADIESALGRPVFVDATEAESSAADVSLTIRVHAEEVRAELELRETANGAGLGRRTLVTESCGELSEAVALALSLMLDFTVLEIPELQARAAEAERDPEGEPPVEAEPPPVEEPTPPPEEPPPEPPEKQPEPAPNPPAPIADKPIEDELPRPELPSGERWTVDLRLGGAWSVGGSLGGLGAAAAFGLRSPSGLYFDVAASHYFQSSREAQGGQVSFERSDASLAACPLHLGGDAELRACSRVGVGWLRADSSGFDETLSPTGWTAAAGLAVLGVLPLSPAVLWVEVAGDVALRRAKLFVSEGDQIHDAYSMSPLWGTIAGGAGIVFD